MLDLLELLVIFLQLSDADVKVGGGGRAGGIFSMIFLFNLKTVFGVRF